MSELSVEELREVCNLTIELTRLRQAECKHLCIENIAPRLFGKLLDVAIGRRYIEDCHVAPAELDYGELHRVASEQAKAKIAELYPDPTTRAAKKYLDMYTSQYFREMAGP